MRYCGVAFDYDGTLATDGKVDEGTVAALERLRGSGRRLIMVTGRELPDLHATFAHVTLFDRVVAENGGLLHRPAEGTATPLAPPPSPAFLAAIRARGVRASVGAVIVATWQTHYDDVCAVIRELALDLDVISNKGAVMVLPTGINKGTGLARAAAELSIPLPSLVGIGDAENDYTLLRACGLGVAVANALPSLKEQADLVTRGARGAGVVEVVDALLRNDLADTVPRPREAIGVVAHEADARNV